MLPPIEFTGTMFPNVGTGVLAVNPATNQIYMSLDNNKVEAMSGFTTNVVFGAITTIPTPVDFTFAIAVNPVTDTVYIANDNNTVSAYKTTVGADGTFMNTTTITVGSDPTATAVNPVTNMVYVLNNGNAQVGEGSVTVIDGATNTAVGTIPTGQDPVGIAVNPVTNMVFEVADTPSDVGNPALKVQYLEVIKGATHTTPASGFTTVELAPGGYSNPYAIAVNPVTNKIYVTDSNRSLYIVDGTQISTRTPAGAETYIYDTHTAVINGSTVYPQPRGLAVNTVNNTIYVADGYTL